MRLRFQNFETTFFPWKLGNCSSGVLWQSAWETKVRVLTWVVIVGFQLVRVIAVLVAPPQVPSPGCLRSVSHMIRV